MNIRTVHVLAPAVRTTTATSPAAADGPAPGPVAPAGPVKTRETASAGYRRALEVHRAVAPPRQGDPALATAVERQGQARRELADRAFSFDRRLRCSPRRGEELRAVEGLAGGGEAGATCTLRTYAPSSGRRSPGAAGRPSDSQNM